MKYNDFFSELNEKYSMKYFYVLSNSNEHVNSIGGKLFYMFITNVDNSLQFYSRDFGWIPLDISFKSRCRSFVASGIKIFFSSKEEFEESLMLQELSR